MDADIACRLWPQVFVMCQGQKKYCELETFCEYKEERKIKPELQDALCCFKYVPFSKGKL